MATLKADTEGYVERECVICGRRYRVYDKPGQGKPHRCPKAVLARRAAAERHAENVDDPIHPAIPRHLDDRRLTYNERLAMGFEMLRMAA